MLTTQNHRAQKSSLRAQEQLLEAELAEFERILAQSWQERELPLQVRQVLTYICVHLFDERLSVAFVCAECHLGDHNISIYFKRVVGKGMREYIEEQRIQAAERLLCHGELPIQRIAWAVGYTYPESFDRSFRRCTGCSPAEFRRRAQTKCPDELSRRSVNASAVF